MPAESRLPIPSISIAAAAPDPELRFMKETYPLSFQAALTGALRDLSPRERNVLRLSLCQGLSIDEISVPYAVHHATVARWLTAIKARLLEGVRERFLADHPGLSESDVSSLIRVLETQMHVSLSRLLKTDAPTPDEKST